MFHRLQFWISVFPLILSLFIAISVFIILRFLPARLPLFYSLAWGENQLANHLQFLVIPASICAIAIINMVIIGQLHSSQVFFKKILNLSSVVVSLILIVTFIKIILNFI